MKNFGIGRSSIASGIAKDSLLTFQNATFEQNAAVEGALFFVQDEAKIICNDCKIRNNFALNGGVASAFSSGHYNIIGSTIHENTAVSLSVLEITDCVHQS